MNNNDEKILEILKDQGIDINFKEAKIYEPTFKPLNCFENFKYIDMDNLSIIDDEINFFDYPNEEDLLFLKNSISTTGLIFPLLVLFSPSDNGYILICGRSRYIALTSLYEETKDLKYKNIPCMVLNADNVDLEAIQLAIIESNLDYRSISRKAFIKAILIQDKILKSSKKSRNSMNVANTISEKFHISRASVLGYTCFHNLSPSVLGLVCREIIDLQIGRALSKVPHDIQEKIVSTLGREEINDLFKVLNMIDDFTNPSKKEKTVENKDVDVEMEDVEASNKSKPIEKVKKITKIVLHVANEAVEEVIECLCSVKNSILRTEFDVNHMNNLIDFGFVKIESFVKLNLQSKENKAY